jgi:alkylated DNA repair dioxygenase AlkB
MWSEEDEIPAHSAPVTYIPNFVSDSDMVFDALWKDLPWERRTRRREYWTNSLNRDYTYGSGVGQRTYQSNITHPMIEYVTDLLEPVVGFRYEGCFLNGYEDAKDALGYHSDDDPGINHERPIAVVTVGGGRDIHFKEIGEPDSTHEHQFLDSGSLLLMHAGMQSTHLHKIPKAGFVVTKPRISLTFRSLK